MLIIRTSDKNFKTEFNILMNRSSMDMNKVLPIVNNILFDIKQRGDMAIKEHVIKFDNWNCEDMAISLNDMKRAYDNQPKNLKDSIKVACERISNYHKKQIEKTWIEFEGNGEILGQKITPVNRAGIYVPGGKAAYPSSLIMNYIPAKVAGVGEIAVCTPAMNGEVNELLLATMHFLGVKEAYKIGGASAIGALAYGTESINKVDVITGPGNIFVATAKKLVFGDVNIDMIAGPSEVGIFADATANPKNIAIDLLSQAEHDELASSYLISCDENFALKVRDEIYNILPNLNRKDIARKSIDERAAIIIVKDLKEAIDIINQLAVEHLELAVDNAFEILPFIKNAGAIFLGHYTPEAMGDYLAGPNHTLPTGGSAKFFSPLGVYNFIKRTSIISFNKRSFLNLSNYCMDLANAEGLGAHALSIDTRKCDIVKDY